MKIIIVTSMDNNTIIDDHIKKGELQTRNYLSLFPYGASAKNLEQFTSWFNERHNAVNYFQQLDKIEFQNLVTQRKRAIGNSFLHVKE